ncbi:hypothetical protein LQZ18_03190 [Lachnospiraceae bacterium ZAX-1]
MPSVAGNLHRIGDSIVGAVNNSEIRGMENKLFGNDTTKSDLETATHDACNDVGSVLIQSLKNHTELSIAPLDGEIIYKGENFADIDEKLLNAKIQNNLANENLQYRYALLLEKLRRFPMDRDTIGSLNTLTLARVITDGNSGADSLNVIDQVAGDYCIVM